jgi:hypothetical protein
MSQHTLQAAIYRRDTNEDPGPRIASDAEGQTYLVFRSRKTTFTPKIPERSLEMPPPNCPLV